MNLELVSEIVENLCTTAIGITLIICFYKFFK